MRGLEILVEDGRIRVARSAAVDLAFRALARVDLGRDAANLFAGAAGPTAATPELTAAWPGAAGRLALHGLALLHLDPGELLEVLRWSPPPVLADPAGRRLCRALAAALEAEEAGQGPWVKAGAPAPDPQLLPRLTALRQRLWAPLPVPRLLLLDSPALGRHGRGLSLPGEERVALSIGRPLAEVLALAVHEECHARTDPTLAPTGRDTRLGSPGFAVHEALERAACELAARVLAGEQKPGANPGSPGPRR